MSRDRWSNTIAATVIVLGLGALCGLLVAWWALWTWLLGTDNGLVVAIISLFVLATIGVGAVVDITERKS